MRYYRLTLTLPSGDLHELQLAAPSRDYATDLAVAALELYNASSATLEPVEAPPRCGMQVHRPYWLRPANSGAGA